MALLPGVDSHFVLFSVITIHRVGWRLLSLIISDPPGALVKRYKILAKLKQIRWTADFDMRCILSFQRLLFFNNSKFEEYLFVFGGEFDTAF